MHGELLNPRLFTRRTSWPNKPNYHLNLHQDPAEYFAKHVFPPNVGKYSVVGYKFFLEHALNNNFGQVMDMIASIKDMRIIHLFRENIMDSVVSLCIAKRDDIYIVQEGSIPVAKSTVHIDEERFFHLMQHTEARQLMTKAAFPTHDRFNVSFHSLTHNTDRTMESLLQWLRVDVMPLTRRMKLIRQRTRPKRDVVENFNELREATAIKHPEWLKYFDEDPEDLPTVLSATPQLVCAS